MSILKPLAAISCILWIFITSICTIVFMTIIGASLWTIAAYSIMMIILIAYPIFNNPSDKKEVKHGRRNRGKGRKAS